MLPRYVKDRTGIKYNYLTAVEYQETKNGRVIWRCLCDCGAEVFVSGGDLHSGKQKSCKECGKARQRASVTQCNSYKIVDDIVYVDVSNNTRQLTMEIDIDDIGFINDGLGRWAASTSNGKPYARRLKSNCIHILINKTPKGMLTDHIDGNTLNNRRCNLRTVDYVGNNRNAELRKDNKTGCPGVCFHRRIGKYQASIKSNKKDIHLGYFDDLNKAIIARKNAEIKFGYHKNHGRDKVEI